MEIAVLKGLGAGAVNTGLALSLGAKFPTFSFALATGLVDLLGYGVSLTLFVFALRSLPQFNFGSLR